MQVKGRRCEVTVDPAKYTNVTLRMEQGVTEHRSGEFKIPLVSNASGESHRISPAEAKAAFRTM